MTALLGVLVAGGLAIGGISVALAYGIVGNHAAMVQEYAHAQNVDAVHAAFHDLLFELHQIDSTRDAGRLMEALVIQEDLARQLNQLGELHPRERDAAEAERERELLAELRGLADGARDLTVRFKGQGRLDAAELDWMHRATHVVPRRVEELARLHRARVELLVEQSRNSIRTIALLYAVFLLLGVGLLVMVSIGLNRAIAAPLRRLAVAARSIAEGHLEARVRVTSRDEIGQLSDDFNFMAQQLETHEHALRRAQHELEQKVREAQALQRIGTDIARLRRLDDTLQFVVDQAHELLGCDVAALLLSQTGGGPHRPVTSGPPEAFDADAALPDPELGGLACPVRPEFRWARLVAPVELGEGQRGVLAVGARDERAFTPADRELLAGLAAHAAIALETARLSDELRDTATLQERERLAREIHDSLAQSLALINLELQAALTLPDASPRLTERLGGLVRLTDQAYQDVRQAIFGLRILVSRGLGLVPTLSEYLHEFSVQSGIAVDLEVADGALADVPAAWEVQVVRIIQESLVNVRKHARTAHARVRCWAEGDVVRIAIEDDGAGWDVAQPRAGALHFGLQTMRERAESLGGTLEVSSARGAGTRVVASLPRASR